MNNKLDIENLPGFKREQLQDCFYCKKYDNKVKKITFKVIVGGREQPKDSVEAHIKCFDNLVSKGINLIKDVGFSSKVIIGEDK